MTRRICLLALAAAPLRADARQDILDLFTNLSAALSSGDPVQFIQMFDSAMPGYHMLEINVAALARQAQVKSSIEILSDEGDDALRKVDLDWYINIVQTENGAASAQRREIIHCRVAREKKKWRIVSLEPLAFFAPPTPSP